MVNMNGTSLAIIQPSELDTIREVGALLATSGYFDGKGNTPQAIAMMATKIMAGREMGFGPFASVNGIHIISGKPSVGANLMASAVKSSARYDYRVKEMTNDKCVIEFFEREGDKKVSIGVSEFTKEDANKAGTQNMNKFALNMLFARAMSNGVRWYCPDIFSGNAVYVPEELGAEVDGDGNIVEATYSVTQPERIVDTTSTENVPQRAPVQATDDTEYNGPTDEELEILGTWRNPQDAQAWAVEVRACDNMHHAGQAWMGVVKACKGFTQRNAGAVYLAFLRDRTEKLQELAVAA